MILKEKTGELKFTYLPAFALFLRDHQLNGYVKEQLRMAREVRLPLLRYFETVSEEQIIGIFKRTSYEFLTYLIENRAKEQIADSLEKWLSDQLPKITREQVVAEDITLVSFIRKQAFLAFLPAYTKDPEKMIATIQELDRFMMESETASTNTFIELLKDRINDMLQRLQRSEELHTQAQAITHLGNYTLDLTNNGLIWSDELYRIYEMDPKSGDIDKDKIFQYNHPDDRSLVNECIGKAIATHQPFNFHYRIVLPDKIKILQARGEVMLDESGKAQMLLGTAQDVTEEKTIEKQLRENQTFIQKIADATPSIITSYNIHTGKYVFINRGIEKLLGYDPVVALEQGVVFFASLIHPEDLAMLTVKNSKALELANQHGSEDKEIIIEFQYRMRHKNGNYRWLHTYGTVFDRNAEKQVEHVLNISIDITERMESEQVLFRKNLELQQSNASLEEFAYVASHDLQEPLRKISTFGDRLLSTQKENLDQDGKTYLEKIITSSLRMQQMINDLLSISMISGDKTFQPHSLEKILNEVLQTLEHKIEENNVVINASPLPKANVVASQFRQLFQNLLSNSLKFARSGVKLHISITSTVLKPGDVSRYHLFKAHNYLKITFSDNGIGFNEIFAEKIFAIFQRLHTKTEYEGTGIGLAICKKIVENHGGVITASGVLNEGASFTIIIPK